MDWSELYSQGLIADMSWSGGVCPPWALSLGWDHEGVWVVVALRDLEAAVPNLKVYSPSGRPAHLLLKRAPDTSNLLPNFFDSLETQGVPIIAFMPDLQLVCNGGVISRGFDGETVIVGDFLLEATPPSGTNTLRLLLPRRLVLTSAPGSATTGGPPELIVPFRVRARITLSAEELYEPREPHRLMVTDEVADAPVFLNDSRAEALLTHGPPPSTPPARPRRPSLGNRLSQFSPFRSSQLPLADAGAGAPPVRGAGRGAMAVVNAFARAGTDATTGSKVAR